MCKVGLARDRQFICMCEIRCLKTIFSVYECIQSKTKILGGAGQAESTGEGLGEFMGRLGDREVYGRDLEAGRVLGGGTGGQAGPVGGIRGVAGARGACGGSMEQLGVIGGSLPCPSGNRRY